MGALWELKVTGVDKAEKTIQIHVTKVHPDAGPHLQTKTFAMSLLIDLYRNHSKGYSVLPSVAHTVTDGDKFANYRAGSALTKNAAAAHPDRAEMERLVGVVNGVEVQLTEQEYASKDVRKARYPTMRGYGSSSTTSPEGVETVRYTGILGIDDAEVRGEAEAVVAAVNWRMDQDSAPDDTEPTDDEDDGRWRTHGVLEVALHSKGLLHLLEEGQQFDSAAYY